jgi:hypothetical protein
MFFSHKDSPSLSKANGPYVNACGILQFSDICDIYGFSDLEGEECVEACFWKA